VDCLFEMFQGTHPSWLSRDGEAAGDLSSDSGIDLSADGSVLVVPSQNNKAGFDVERSGHVRVFGLPSSCISSDPPAPFSPGVSVPKGNNKPGAVVGSVLAVVVVIVTVGLLFVRNKRKSKAASSVVYYDKTESQPTPEPRIFPPPPSSTLPKPPVPNLTHGNDHLDRRSNRMSPLPNFKDQAYTVRPEHGGIAPRHPPHDPNDLPQYKDQVRHSAGHGEHRVHEGRRVVGANPERKLLLDSASEVRTPATARVLDTDEIQRMSGCKVRVEGGTIPVALPVFLDDGDKNKSSDEQGVSDDESCVVEERVESNDIEKPSVENDER